ncbi:hypothetical protein [Aeromonas veronii]|uniref:hypothetical protein n=1 Tax=Aeromonas veronii TaxID=654 RepID=UPI0038DAF4EF
MTMRIFSRAAKRADQFIATIADQLNGNAARRCAIKQRLYLAMLAAEQHHIVAARAAKKHTTGFAKNSALLHWRIDYLRHAV